MRQVHLDQEQLFSDSLNFVAFVDGSSDFFEVAARVIVFSFVVVDDDKILDAIVVAVGLNLVLVRVVLPLG